MTMRSLRRKPAGPRLTQMARARWWPVTLVSGALLMIIIGAALPSVPALVLGMVVLGSSVPNVGPHSPTAAMVRAWAWLDADRPSHR